MYDDPTIRSICDVAVVEHLRRKRTGANNNNKGSTYEGQFAAVRICCEAADVIQRRRNNEPIARRCVHNGYTCFVDDVVVSEGDSRPLRMSQLKSGTAVRWTDGKTNRIEDDFRHQKNVDAAHGYQPTYEIVVADNDNVQNLRTKQPSDLQHVAVVHFPEADFRSIWKQDQGFRQAVAYLLDEKSPLASQGRAIFTYMIGIWGRHRDASVDVDEAIREYREQRKAAVGRGAQP